MVDEKQKGVTLTLTEDCNLSCVYCYEKHKTDRIMDYDTAKKILDHELTVDDGFGSVTIDFFGGEPFLEFDLMQQICEYVWNNTWPKNYIFFASTNGTLLHGNIKNWLTKHRDKFWVGLSFDGNEKMQNVNRCNSYDMIDLDFFRENWPNQGVKMTISDATLSSLEQGCMFLHSKGFIVNCNLAYGLDWSNSLLLDHLERELMALIEYYVCNISIQPCSMLNMEISYVTQNMDHVKWCGAGTQMKVYSPEGDCYPCHYFEPLAIGDEMARKSLSFDFSNPTEYMDTSCKDCAILPICPTCYGSNFASTGDISIKDKNLCRLTKVIALANSFLNYRKLSMYSNQELGINDERRKELTDAILKIQNSLAFEFSKR